jgi:hypothetical protein
MYTFISNNNGPFEVCHIISAAQPLLLVEIQIQEIYFNCIAIMLQRCLVYMATIVSDFLCIVYKDKQFYVGIVHQ